MASGISASATTNPARNSDLGLESQSRLKLLCIAMRAGIRAVASNCKRAGQGAHRLNPANVYGGAPREQLIQRNSAAIVKLHDQLPDLRVARHIRTYLHCGIGA